MFPQKSPRPVRLIKAGLDYLLYAWNALIPLWRSFFFFRLNLLIPLKARTIHTYIIGGTGSGKSELLKLFILDLIRRKPRQATVFLLEPHGELSEEVARLKEHQNPENLIYFSTDLKDGFLPCINPLEIGEGIRDMKQINTLAEQLTKVFSEIMGNSSSLTDNMETLVHAVLTVLLIRPDSTLLDFQRFMRDEENADLVAYAVQHCPEGQRHFFQSGFYEKTFSTTKDALYKRVQRLFNSETFYRLVIGKSTINIREAMNSKKTVIFKLSQGDMGENTMDVFGRFIVGMVQGLVFERAKLPPEQRTPLYLFIDEFQNFVSPNIKKILTEARKYKLHLTVAQQQYGQDTSPDLRKSIANNTAVKITGHTEAESLDAIHKFMPEVSKQAIQSLRLGEFAVKVKPTTIFQENWSERKASKLKITTSYLGFRHSMNSQHWQKIAKHQIKHYYRAIESPQGDTSPKKNPDYQKLEKTPQAAKYESLAGIYSPLPL